MGVYTFVCRSSRSEWNAKQTKGGDIEASASSTKDLEKKLAQACLSRDSGVVSTFFGFCTPSSAVCDVIVSGGGGFIASGRAAPVASSGGAAAAVAPAAEEKKEEMVEESDEDMPFSIFEEEE